MMFEHARSNDRVGMAWKLERVQHNTKRAVKGKSNVVQRVHRFLACFSTYRLLTWVLASCSLAWWGIQLPDTLEPDGLYHDIMHLQL